MALKSFAIANSIPMMGSGSTKLGTVDRTLGDEAFQLFSIQFKILRYPLIDSIEDVLRLREDKYLEDYRNMIDEYSAKLHQARLVGEVEKQTVLLDSQKFTHSSMKRLSRVAKINKFADFGFYLSIPLAIAGAVTMLPLGDIILIPAVGAAKIYTHLEKKKATWLLFGRPDLAE